jgi:hypothetical protein
MGDRDGSMGACGNNDMLGTRTVTNQTDKHVVLIVRFGQTNRHRGVWMALGKRVYSAIGKGTAAAVTHHLARKFKRPE